MPKTSALREQRRAARAAHERRQRIIWGSAIGAVILIIAAIYINSLIRQQQANAQATQTTVAQMATNTVIASTQNAQQATQSALGATQTVVASATNAVLGATQTAIATANPMLAFPGIPSDATAKPDGLKIKDVVVGTGAEAKAGSTLDMQYTGWLENGTKFDSSVDRNQPFSFVLGNGSVIKGWDEGIVGMKAGGRRILVIPPELGYGASGQGSIPPNATLVFIVELVSVK